MAKWASPSPIEHLPALMLAGAAWSVWTIGGGASSVVVVPLNGVEPHAVVSAATPPHVAIHFLAVGVAGRVPGHSGAPLGCAGDEGRHGTRRGRAWFLATED